MSRPCVSRLATPLVLLTAFTIAGRAPLAAAGIVSEAVALTGAGALHFEGVLGTGVKVAVVDLGFIGLGDAKAAGELPPGTIGIDLTGMGMEADTEHGVGVAELVRDMAPGAELFCLRIEDELDLCAAADSIASRGIRIAVLGTVWPNASYYDGAGPLAAIIDESRNADGVFWVVPAGDAAQRHWRGPWIDPEPNGLLNFAGGLEALPLAQGIGPCAVYLNWNQYGAVATDLDLRIVDRFGMVVAASATMQLDPGGVPTGAPPCESVSFPADPAGAPYEAVVAYREGTTTGLDITVFTSPFAVGIGTPVSSLLEPADAADAFSVGAVHFHVWGDPNPALEVTSSQGPTTDGRNGLALVAPDGTSSFTYGPAASFGTGIAAGVVAGAAALLLDMSPYLGPAALRQTLLQMAEDIAIPGVDPATGAGKLRVLRIMSDTEPPSVRPRNVLLPNSPNPFNPGTAIRFDLATECHVVLDIHDSAGRHVVRLLEAVRPPGDQSVVWDGRDGRGRPVTAGIYYCTLHANGERQARKLTVVK